MAFQSVQFYTKENVLRAYENAHIDTWAIFIDKNRFAKGEGADELSAALSLLEQGASNATMNLRLYEDIEAKDLKSNEAPDFGFNFKLNAPGMTITGYNQASLDYRAELVSKISGLEKKIEKLTEERPEENKLGMIGNILDHPVLGNIIEAIGMAFVNKAMNNNGATPQPAPRVAMAGVGSIATDADLIAALEKLKQYDPKLTEHLQKLAAVAQHDPGTFNFLISSIDRMQL